MADAYRCDWCDAFHEGIPHKHLAAGQTDGAAASRVNSSEANWELCEECWHRVIQLKEETEGGDPP